MEEIQMQKAHLYEAILLVNRDVRVREDRRRWFFTPEEQRDWERQYSKPAGDIPRTEGEANP